MNKKIEVGLRLNGKINNVTDFGIFVSLQHKVSGLVHKSDFVDWDKERIRYQVGDEVRVVVMKIEQDKISLSINHVNDAKLIDPQNSFNSVKTKDFYQTLTETVDIADNKIKKLKKKSDGH